MSLKTFVRELWPAAATVSGAVLIACELPRKAIFQERLETARPAPWASFVKFDEAQCAALLANARASWQVRAAALSHDSSGHGLFDGVDSLAEGDNPGYEIEREPRARGIPTAIGDELSMSLFAPPTSAAGEDIALDPEPPEKGKAGQPPAFSRESLLLPPPSLDLL